MSCSSSEKRRNAIFVYSPRYHVDIGSHVFPTEKYRLIRERLEKLGKADRNDVLLPEPATPEELRTVHTSGYIDDMVNLRWTSRTARSELPITSEIIEGAFLCAGGTDLTCRLAGKTGVAVHLGGGFHHAFPDHAEGFCYVNDIAVAIKVLKKEGGVNRVFVVDCDLHQGNGTALIFQNDPDVFTFSIHQERNYPVKERSDLDIGLDDGVGDEEYLARLAGVIPGKVVEFGADLVVYVAGADPFEGDQIGGLRLSIEGLKRRDELVMGGCAREKIPCAVVMAGGYALHTEDTIAIHTNTCLVALECRDRLGKGG